VSAAAVTLALTEQEAHDVQKHRYSADSEAA
jgi:hypothetical protein